MPDPLMSPPTGVGRAVRSSQKASNRFRLALMSMAECVTTMSCGDNCNRSCSALVCLASAARRRDTARVINPKGSENCLVAVKSLVRNVANNDAKLLEQQCDVFLQCMRGQAYCQDAVFSTRDNAGCPEFDTIMN